VTEQLVTVLGWLTLGALSTVVVFVLGVTAVHVVSTLLFTVRFRRVYKRDCAVEGRHPGYFWRSFAGLWNPDEVGYTYDTGQPVVTDKDGNVLSTRRSRTVYRRDR
jgi:hypothetical protein